jgi:ubiquinone/menaquinone biosynthesis C-methylase UbiE
MADRDQAVLREQSREWDSVAPAWEKNDQLILGWDDVNQQLVKSASIATGHSVVDIGSGTGYPALMIARHVGEKGRVVGLDFSDGMLEVARRKAKSLGITNVTFRQHDVSTLPFESEIFDAASSRFCFMLLPEPDKTLRELFRVLKTGGFFAASVWAEKEKNPNITIPMEILREYCPPPEGDTALPGIFSLSEPGVLMEKMSKAGFSEFAEKEIPTERRFSSGEECISRLKEMAAPFKKMFAALDGKKGREVEKKMVDAIENFRRGDEIVLPGVALIVSGSKPLAA